MSNLVVLGGEKGRRWQLSQEEYLGEWGELKSGVKAELNVHSRTASDGKDCLKMAIGCLSLVLQLDE